MLLRMQRKFLFLYRLTRLRHLWMTVDQVRWSGCGYELYLLIAYSIVVAQIFPSRSVPTVDVATSTVSATDAMEDIGPEISAESDTDLADALSTFGDAQEGDGVSERDLFKLAPNLFRLLDLVDEHGSGGISEFVFFLGTDCLTVFLLSREDHNRPKLSAPAPKHRSTGVLRFGLKNQLQRFGQGTLAIIPGLMCAIQVLNIVIAIYQGNRALRHPT
jgi:hypothetical protein